MTTERIKRMMDACYLAQRARSLLPPLPKGVLSSYIQYLDIIQRLEKQGMRVKVSDISGALALPRPGVTRTVKEMTAKGYLTKTASEEDGRVTYLTITEAGASSGKSTTASILPPCSLRWRTSRTRMPRL